MRAIEKYINDHRIKKLRPPIDFSTLQPGVGASIGDVVAVLKEKFNVQMEGIPIAKIQEALKHGPILVAVKSSTAKSDPVLPPAGHAEMIVGMASPDSYYVYNPLNPHRGVEIIKASDIIFDEPTDKAGKVTSRTPTLFAASPQRKGQAR